MRGDNDFTVHSVKCAWRYFLRVENEFDVLQVTEVAIATG